MDLFQCSLIPLFLGKFSVFPEGDLRQARMFYGTESNLRSYLFYLSFCQTLRDC